MRKWNASMSCRATQNCELWAIWIQTLRAFIISHQKHIKRSETYFLNCFIHSKKKNPGIFLLPPLSVFWSLTCVYTQPGTVWLSSAEKAASRADKVKHPKKSNSKRRERGWGKTHSASESSSNLCCRQISRGAQKKKTGFKMKTHTHLQLQLFQLRCLPFFLM